jgi:hypothetical protein
VHSGVGRAPLPELPELPGPPFTVPCGKPVREPQASAKIQALATANELRAFATFRIAL